MNPTRQQLALSVTSKANNISLARKVKLILTNGFGKETGASNQQFWKPYKVGNYIYYAAGTDGIIVFHISDDGDLTYHTRVAMYNTAGVLTSHDVRGITHIGDTLFVTAWKFSNLAVSMNNGMVAAYDISDPANFSATDWLSTHTGVSHDTVSPVRTPAWLQDPVTDGEFIYIAAQYDGLYVIDPDLAGGSLNMTEHGACFTGGANWPNPVWEGSNITIKPSLDYVILSNHGSDGVAVRIVNISDPANPVLTKSIDIFYAPNGDPLRVRSVWADNDYLYCSTNSDNVYLNSPYRGLLMLDITDIPNLLENGDDWIHVPIDAVDQDNEYEHGDVGDPACVGVYRYGYYVFVSAGRKGVAVFNVRDKSNPYDVGIMSNETTDPTNLYHPRPVYHNGKSYLIYGSGAEGVDTHTVYLDEIKTS